MNLFKRKKKKLPEYYVEEAVKTIKEHTSLSTNDILDVLKGNDFYMKKMGILDISNEEIEYNYNWYKEKLK